MLVFENVNKIYGNTNVQALYDVNLTIEKSGIFKKFDDAVNARIKAENYYFGEYNFQT